MDTATTGEPHQHSCAAGEHSSSQPQGAAGGPARGSPAQAQPNARHVPLANEDSYSFQCIDQQTMPKVSVRF